MEPHFYLYLNSRRFARLMKSRIILDTKRFQITVKRLCHQLIENHANFSNSCIVGIQPRGVFLAERIHQNVTRILKRDIDFGKLDNTFYRDDFRSSEKQLTPRQTEIDFLVENKNVILVDDVMHTGRTIRAAMEALLDYGRPKKVELMVLVERRFSRQLPIQPDYVGLSVDSMQEEKVRVEWKEDGGEDKIWILPLNENEE
jgi:pyrimidine operon attenuation protein/uracil phosphoribosyltransferase